MGTGATSSKLFNLPVHWSKSLPDFPSKIPILDGWFYLSDFSENVFGSVKCQMVEKPVFTALDVDHLDVLSELDIFVL